MFLFEDLFRRWFKGKPNLRRSDATFKLVRVMARVVIAKVFVFVHDLNSEWNKERGPYFNNNDGLTVERLVGSNQIRAVVRDNDFRVARRIIYLHPVGSEASCHSI